MTMRSWVPFTQFGLLTSLTDIDPTLTRGESLFSDGLNIYLMCHTNSKLVRLNTSLGITGILDLSLFGGTFTGGFTDGRYGYLLPHGTIVGFTKILRIDLQNFTLSGVTVLDPGPLDTTNLIFGANGGFTDGQYGYATYSDLTGNSYSIVRFSTLNFTTSGCTILTLATTTSPMKVGSSAQLTDGTYGYFLLLVGPDTDCNYVMKIVKVTLATMTIIDTLTFDILEPQWKGMTMLIDNDKLYVSPNVGLKMKQISLYPIFGLCGEFEITNGVTANSQWGNACRLGRYGYFLSAYHPTIMRIDLDNPGAYEIFTTTNTDPDGLPYGLGLILAPWLFVTSDSTTVGRIMRIQIGDMNQEGSVK